MKKIVFFDIDGTLLDHQKNLPNSTKKAIQRLKENGVFVAIATGRAPFMFEDLRDELDIDSFVSFNGQYVVFEDEVIYENTLSEAELDRLLKASRIKQHPLVFMNETAMKASVDRHPFISEGLASLGFSHPMEDVKFYQNRKIHQALLFCPEHEERQYINEYEKFHFIRWHPLSVDILPKGGSKAEGIKKLIERLGFALKDVYAFGDGLNDLEMLRSVGTGVAMGNGVHEAKINADLVTSDVTKDGIWNGLKELELI